MEKDTKKKKNGFIKEFKTFIQKGNVIDLAVGVIIGGAFGKIVTSVVDDILMPILGIIIGGLDFSSLTLRIGDATVRYGLFINNVINFLIIAFCIFIMIKALNKLSKKEEAKEEKVIPKKSNEEILLEEILKELKKSK